MSEAAEQIEEEAVEAEVEEDNFLDMSDEDFLNSNFDEPDEVIAEQEVAEEDDTEPAAQEEKADDEEDADTDDAGDDVDTPSDSTDDDGDDDSGDPEPSDSDKNTEGDEPEIDYKAAYEQVMGEFKANGKVMKLGSVEEAQRLIQQGANYNKKMQGMKPHLKILKTLENNGISEDKLNFLIDLDKKDPAAIARLVKEAGIDPEDMDLEQGDKYTAADHAAGEQELALDSVIESIKDTKTYNQLLDVVGDKWDAASKQIVVQQPELLTLINDHMASGIYGVISTEVERQQMLGQLNGMSDLDAYRSIGDAIQARGGFDSLFQPEQEQLDLPPVDAPTPDRAKAEAKRKDKKRAASPTKAAPSSPAADFNPLNMSDEEFEKQFNAKYS